MTPQDRLEAIFDRLGNMERESARHHALMEGEIVRVGDKLADLDHRVRVQNSRVTKAEHRIGELETQARIAHHHAAEEKADAEWWRDKGAAIVIGSVLAVLGGIVGHFL